mmetsp:Transcript_8956/g.32796  ORF Transcript_8956/g.32796 Transcript_8956/m.32796 type:complete len:364 (-) Transcript_8956:440-1531(-)
MIGMERRTNPEPLTTHRDRCAVSPAPSAPIPALTSHASPTLKFLHLRYTSPSLSYATGCAHTRPPLRIRSCCPVTSLKSSPKTWFAISVHTSSIPGTYFAHPAKSSAMRYSRRVRPGSDGTHTWSWWRWLLHSAHWTPSSNCAPFPAAPACDIPMCESTMHGVTNFMSIGYGFHDPCCDPSPIPSRVSPRAMSCHPSPSLRSFDVTNSTNVGTPQPFANVPVCVNGACARSSRFSISSPCSTGTSSMMSSACVVYPAGGVNVVGNATSGLHVPGHTMTRPSCSPIGRKRVASSRERHVHLCAAPSTRCACVSAYSGPKTPTAVFAAATAASSSATSSHRSPKSTKEVAASPLFSFEMKWIGYQ